MHLPHSLIIIDIDGLRSDVFLKALEAGEVPNIARIVGGREGTRACHVDAVSTAPSITFAAQASIVTGRHPGEHGIPGEDPNCDAVMGLNGGLAHVYLQRRDGRWADRPRYAEDVLPVAEAFHVMNTQGRYAEELHATLDAILIHNVERDGWQAEYQAYLGKGQTQPLGDYLEQHSELEFVDAVNRLRLMVAETCGDLLLIAKGREGYYFGRPTRGVHGGLLPGESETVLTFGYPGGDENSITWLRETVRGVIVDRCTNEGSRRASVADMVPAVSALFGWTTEGTPETGFRA